MRVLLIALATVAFPAGATAQDPMVEAVVTDQLQAIATVQSFFDAMAASNVEQSRRLLLPQGRFVSVREEKGQPIVRSMSVEDYLATLATDKRRRRERMWHYEMRVHGRIAVVWTPYDFWIDGKFSHCGVDVFDLVKAEDGWKIAGATYTIESTGCPPSPLGSLKQP